MEQKSITVQLKEAVAELGKARQAVADRIALNTAYRKKMEETPQYKAYQAGLAALKQFEADAKEIDARVRELALEAYEQTGDKHPAPHVNIRLFTILEYDPGKALGYCQEHLPKALTFDKRTFERVAKAAELDFVLVNKVPKVAIGRTILEP